MFTVKPQFADFHHLGRYDAILTVLYLSNDLNIPVHSLKYYVVRVALPL